MTIDVVIGANYGDEGKGLMVDGLSHFHQDQTVAVVRFNGGAQAGHTVTAPDGRRHIFSHFGSGSLVGVPTILSRFFVLNPVVFYHEERELWALDSDPRVRISDNCITTTPYDVFINREMERQRTNNRHGSCGIGFGETIERIQARGHGAKFTVTDMYNFSPREWDEYLGYLRELYVPARLQNSGFIFDSNTMARMKYECNDDLFIERFNGMVDNKRTTIVDDDVILDGFEHLIFEGAQGLLLDMDGADFPHVTRSKTGITNVLEILDDTGRNWIREEHINVWYMSRAYLTRHGAGPLKGEIGRTELGFDVVDNTNIPNDWQEALRFAPLNVKDLADRVGQDFWFASGVNADCHIVLTCCDQAKDPNVITDIVQQLKTRIRAEITTSYGPTRETLNFNR
jgi:adenylosuccinate synthase